MRLNKRWKRLENLMLSIQKKDGTQLRVPSF